MDVTSTVVVAPEHLSARLGAESVVLGVTKGVYYGLDEVAARIWDLIQVPIAVEEVRDAVVAEFEVDAATCERDLLEFLSQLQAAGMIEVTAERVP
jgi:hypothetical protein